MKILCVLVCVRKSVDVRERVSVMVLNATELCDGVCYLHVFR